MVQAFMATMATSKRSNSGSALCKQWGVHAKHALYRKSGDWYHTPKAFPLVLWDENGYVKFETTSYLQVPEISVSAKEGKDWLSVRKPGISSLAGYVRVDVDGKERVPVKASLLGKVALREYDTAERRSVLKSAEVTYRRRHNRMTNEIRKKFEALKPEQGRKGFNEFDVLLPNYDGLGRDLLIEAKPDPDTGSVRIAIGQLFDYRRFLTRAEATDLSLLTIGPPDESYQDLLQSLEITALWFEHEDCRSMRGNGKAWRKLSERVNLAKR